MATERELLGVLSDNLGILRDRSRKTLELRAITVSQLGDVLANAADRTADERYAEFLRLLPDASGEEKMLFCRKLLPPQEEESPSVARSAPLRISYVQNRDNSEALSAISAYLPATEECGVMSFAQACEAVTDGRSDACLLPTVSSSDGRLFHFYGMLERYELKILLACDIDSEDGTKTVRYVLAGRTSLPTKNHSNCSHLLEFSLTASGGIPFCELFGAAGACSAEILSTDSLPLPYDTGLNRFYFTLRHPPASEKALRLYLSLQFPDCEWIGSYPILPRVTL